MQRAVFYGGSDDLIEVEGVKGAEEFNVYGDGPMMARFNLGGQMRIAALYIEGCWSFAIGQVDESIPLPDWPVRIEQHQSVEYSTRLEIEVPNNVKVFQEKLA